MYIILKNLRADGFLYKVGDLLEKDSKTVDYEKLVALGFIKQVKSPAKEKHAKVAAETKSAGQEDQGIDAAKASTAPTLTTTAPATAPTKLAKEVK